MTIARDVPIPMAMRTLERDPRGYPIPFIVFRDKAGMAHFPINDHRRVASCIGKRLCSICGKRLGRGVWFIGGPRCFTDRAGAFLDPPMHHECATYALRVCPFLGAPSYSKRIDDRKLAPDAVPDGMVILTEKTMPTRQPTIFGFGETDQFTVNPGEPGHLVFVVPSWLYVEYWNNGAAAPAPASEVG